MLQAVVMTLFSPAWAAMPECVLNEACGPAYIHQVCAKG